MSVVLVGILLLLALIGLVRPYIGLLALLIVMELQPGELYPYLAPLHLERVVGVLVLVAFLLNNEKWRIPPPVKWLLAFYAAMLASVPLAFWRGNSLAFCLSFVEIVSYALLASSLLTTEKRLRWFIVTLMLLIDWLGGSALYNYDHGIWQYTMHIQRAIGVTSSAGDPNSLATTLVTALPLAILLMVRSNPPWMRLLGLGSAAIGIVTVVDTGSRAAALSMIFLTLMLFLRKPKNLKFLPVLLLLSPIIWLVIPQQYKTRYETVDHLKSDESYQNRILSWHGGIAMFESNPITGIGPDNYAIANGEKYWPGTGRKHWLDAHSLYFKLLGELGLLGVFTFGGFVICLFRTNFRARQKLIEHGASSFLQEMPSMFNIILCLLLFAGYAAHDLYRSTWYLIGAMTASVSLLPAALPSAAAEQISPDNVLDAVADAQQWSPALLPVLRGDMQAGARSVQA